MERALGELFGGLDSCLPVRGEVCDPLRWTSRVSSCSRDGHLHILTVRSDFVDDPSAGGRVQRAGVCVCSSRRGWALRDVGGSGGTRSSFSIECFGKHSCAEPQRSGCPLDFFKITRFVSSILKRTAGPNCHSTCSRCQLLRVMHATLPHELEICRRRDAVCNFRRTFAETDV